MSGIMKRSLILVLSAILSACATETANLSKERASLQTFYDAAKETTRSYMTRQENDLKSLLRMSSAEMERQGNILIITFDDTDLFDGNAFSLFPEAQKTLKEIASILSRYDKTRIGITDYAAGNREKAEARAKTLAAFLNDAAPLKQVRFWTEGEAQPDACPKEGDCLKNNHIRITLTPTFIQ